MILRAVQEHGIDLSQSILVGDKDSDISAGRAAGVRACYLIAADPGAFAREPRADGVFPSLQAVAALRLLTPV
jgi:D-glycero-D-manno-heptose 1,7-bisphosphate phosphatase